jgi:hypothetical protein
MIAAYKPSPAPHRATLGHALPQPESYEEQGQLLTLLLDLTIEDARECPDIIDYVETEEGLQEVPTAGFVKANAFDGCPRSLCPILQALAQTLAPSLSKPHPLFLSEPITLIFAEAILDGEPLAAILTAEIVAGALRLFGARRFPNFLTSEFAEVIALRLQPSDPQLCAALVRLLAAIASGSPAAAAPFAGSVLKVLRDRPPIEVRVAGARFLLEMVRMRPAFGLEISELLRGFLAGHGAPAVLKALVLQILLVEAEAGVAAVGAGVVGAFLADESHEVVVLALKLAEFAFRDTAIERETFELIFRLLNHTVESVRVHAAAALGQLTPAARGQADVGAVVAALLRFRQRAGFAGQRAALCALMSVTSAADAGLLLEPPIVALVPDALRLLAEDDLSPAAWLRAVFEAAAAAGRGGAVAAMLAELRADGPCDCCAEAAAALDGLAALAPP